MEFSSNIRLVDRANIAVISSLWNQCDIVTDIKNFVLDKPDCQPWSHIETKVFSILENILIPDVLKDNLRKLIQPLGMQILKWVSLVKSTVQAYPNLPDSITFVWNARGIFNYTETTEMFIKSCSDKNLCFCLACIFCIEETILELWPDVGSCLHEKLKRNPGVIEAVAVVYWTHVLSGEINKLMILTEYCGVKDIHVFGFLFFGVKCISSLSYFLKRINRDSRQRLIKRVLHNIFNATRPHDGNVVFFLFSQLTEYDVKQIIIENVYKVLTSFLEWPCVEFFMPVATSTWKKLSFLDYLNLFLDIVEFISQYHLSDIYINLIKQFWRSTPPSFKEYLIHKCINGTFLSRLFLYKNTDEIIQMIFNDCSAEERQSMIFFFEGMNLCDLLAKKEKWDSLKLLVKNCIPNKYILIEFIEKYKHFKYYIQSKESKLRSEVLFQKMNDWY